MKRSQIYVLAALAGVLGYGALTSPSVYAQENSPYSPVVQRIVERFQLNTSEVNTVINEVRTENMAERKAIVTEKLNKAVSENKITEDQKNAVLAKLTEWQNEKLTWTTMTREERQEQRKEHREEMEQWAQDNNIDLHSILGNEGGKGPKSGNR